MIIDGVFSGGGMKAIALVGALQVMEERGFHFKRVAGTSAGALMASLIAVGYTSKEIHDIFDEQGLSHLSEENKSFLPFPFFRWLRLYFKLGMYKGDALEKWINQLLAKKGVETFADLPEGSLRVIASDLSKGRMLVFPDDLEKYGILAEKFSVARAVRMSSSYPFYYDPVFLHSQSGEKSVIVDGGVLSNFPLWLFDRKGDPRKRPVIGFQLSAKLENYPTRKIDNAIDLYQALFLTMKEAHDARYISEHKAPNIVFIPVDHITSTDFEMDEETRKALIEFGRKRTEKFFKKWTY